jgi:hypothetical protein
VNSKSEKTLYIVGGKSGDLSYYSNITTEIITSEIRAACEAGPSVDCKTNTGGALDPLKVISFCQTGVINPKVITKMFFIHFDYRTC